LVYTIPNNNDPGHPYEKGITWGEFHVVHEQLTQSGTLTTEWFEQHLSACYKEGSCNFTTVGGIFELLGEAEYERRGVYRLARNEQPRALHRTGSPH
jgi:hypothetical protein